MTVDEDIVSHCIFFFFFFQAEDGIRDLTVTGVQTCALPILFAALDRLPLQGRSTMQINDFVERMIVDELQARPASKGQYGFPYVLNTSIDNVICHGVPSTTDVLRNGQIVNLDITQIGRAHV